MLMSVGRVVMIVLISNDWVCYLVYCYLKKLGYESNIVKISFYVFVKMGGV